MGAGRKAVSEGAEEEGDEVLRSEGVGTPATEGVGAKAGGRGALDLDGEVLGDVEEEGKDVGEAGAVEGTGGWGSVNEAMTESVGLVGGRTGAAVGLGEDWREGEGGSGGRAGERARVGEGGEEPDGEAAAAAWGGVCLATAA